MASLIYKGERKGGGRRQAKPVGPGPGPSDKKQKKNERILQLYNSHIGHAGQAGGGKGSRIQITKAFRLGKKDF